MIRRLHVDNFRCLNDFELELSEKNIFLGGNGTGKTSVLSVLRRIRHCVVRGAKVADAFPGKYLSLAREEAWQRFRLQVSVNGAEYQYSLAIEHDLARGTARIGEETLLCDEQPLLEFRLGEAQLYRDDHSRGPTYPFDWTQSALSVLNERADNRKLFRFKRELANCVFVRPNPPLFRSESRAEVESMQLNMSDFVDWYRHAAQENMAAVSTLFGELRDALPGFDSINLAESGDARVFKVRYRTSGQSKDYRFGDLSDGQRALIALYSLVFLPSRPISLFIDEPENYLALREVQPWTAAVADRCGDSLEQLVVVSHHPVMIDYLAGTDGRWFSRQEDGPVRVTDQPDRTVDGLSLSEMISRGWHQ